MSIKHSNIVYVRDISPLGGVETWVYELAKKYHNLDIAVVCKTIDPSQLKRLVKLVPVYVHEVQKIECDVAVINYDTSIIPYIEAKDGIYQAIHGDYENPAYKWKSPTSPKIKKYICITKYLEKSVRRITGNKNLMMSYNPLTIDEVEKPLILMSATRLSPIKGRERMEKLAKALDEARVNYIWLVFTNDTNKIDSPNVVYSPVNLDCSKYFSRADYVVQLSDTEACSYTINEALFRNVPVIVTPLPYLEEIGVKDGKNAYIMEFDCSNIDSIVKRIERVPEFTFKRWKDDYMNIFTKKKRESSMNDRVTFTPTKTYNDVELNKRVSRKTPFETTLGRAMYLEGLKLGKITKEGDENDRLR